ncbi:MAG: hypothetical protein ACLU38_06070 [Dysosmobacter sp.]
MEEIASAPPLVNDPALMEQVAGWAEELAGKEKGVPSGSGRHGLRRTSPPSPMRCPAPICC